jgi:hypothetical protein
MKTTPDKISVPAPYASKDRRELKTTKLPPPVGIRTREDYLQHNFPSTGVPVTKSKK